MQLANVERLKPKESQKSTDCFKVISKHFPTIIAIELSLVLLCHFSMAQK